MSHLKKILTSVILGARDGFAISGFVITILCVLATCAGCAARPAPTAYRIELEVYVRDPQALCRRAWDIAVPRFGLSVAEAVTMTRGEFVASKCLAVVYQTAAVDEVVSAGIHVKEILQ
ncbi:MAG TPA: hypothetical protein VEC57_20770 [Candidatus Limnocylindrales bacterium]|nr:hypothetical protein [Candidatus Limnocylindrales bacterium]